MEIQPGDAAVITGAGSGLGEGLAHVCHETGMRVVVADIQLDEADRVASEIREAGGEAIAVLTDVSDPASVAALAARAYEEFGEVRLLCNNAGVQVFKPLVGTSADDWRWVLGVNVHGVIHGIDAFVPRMRQQAGAAHIVNTGSISGCGPYPRPTTMAAGAYITSKYAVVGLSEALHATSSSPRGSASPCSARPASARASSMPSATARRRSAGRRRRPWISGKAWNRERSDGCCWTPSARTASSSSRRPGLEGSSNDGTHG